MDAVEHPIARALVVVNIAEGMHQFFVLLTQLVDLFQNLKQ